jgi:hypothetical protein
LPDAPIIPLLTRFSCYKTQTGLPKRDNLATDHPSGHRYNA